MFVQTYFEVNFIIAIYIYILLFYHTPVNSNPEGTWEKEMDNE